MDTLQTQPAPNHSGVRIAIVVVLVIAIIAIIVASSKNTNTPSGDTSQTEVQINSTQQAPDTKTELEAIEADLEATTFEGTSEGL